jgi:hypothetical protein
MEADMAQLTRMNHFLTFGIGSIMSVEGIGDLNTSWKTSQKILKVMWIYKSEL